MFVSPVAACQHKVVPTQPRLCAAQLGARQSGERKTGQQVRYTRIEINVLYDSLVYWRTGPGGVLWVCIQCYFALDATCSKPCIQ